MAMHDCSIELHIDYDNEGITSRRVSVFGYEWNEKETAVVIHGFCHLRLSEKSFNSRKIVHCVNLADNREIGDMAGFFRMIEGRPAPITEQIPVLPLTRSNDVGGFRRRFRPEILYYQFKLNFFSLFDNKCFKCKRLAAWDKYPESDEIMGGLLRQKQLVIDHHVALENGGRYQPGNLVSLCQRCNGRKHTMHPKDFYDDQELAKLEPYLIVQSDIFPPEGKFWEWKKYEQFIDGDIDVKRTMLTGENVEPALIEICLTNPNHYYYCGWRRTSLVDSPAVLQVSAAIDQQQSPDDVGEHRFRSLQSTAKGSNREDAAAAAPMKKVLLEVLIRQLAYQSRVLQLARDRFPVKKAPLPMMTMPILCSTLAYDETFGALTSV
jgi:hypothetical protein